MQRSILKTANEIKAWFSSVEDVVAFDWETTGLNYTTMEPVGVSFCDGERSCYVPVNNNKCSDLLSACDRFMSKSLLVAHNAKFDFQCCRKWLPTEPTSLFCTYIASFLLDENAKSHSLENVAQRYLGKGKTDKWENLDWDSPEFAEYAMVDAELAYELYEIFKFKLEEEELEHVFYNIEMPFVPVMAEMEMNGVLVDQEKLAKLQSKIESKILTCEDGMLDMLGKKATVDEGLFGQKFRNVPVDFNSPQQVIKAFNKLGLEIKDTTPKGNPSVAKSTLESLKGEPFVDLLTEYRMLQKLHSSYVVPAWEMIDADGRIRPNVGIVSTGRTSMSKPNLQQLPNVKDQTINYREIFSTEGQLLAADYSGQELRILGEISKDERICQAFHNNEDLHLVTANHIFDLGLSGESLIDGTTAHTTAKSLYKHERYKAKNGANFPIVYGSSASGIAWRQGVARKEAQRWVDGFFKAYPKVGLCMAQIDTELKRKGYVTTLMGRKRRFPNFNQLNEYGKLKEPSKSRCRRQAFNFKIQGFAADQAKIAGRKIYDDLKAHPEWEARILLLVHDEYVVEVLNESAVEAVRQTIIECMENAISLSIPFVVECKSGQNYSEIK